MSDLDRLAAALSAHGDVRRDELMSRHTTFGVGGPADVFVTVRNANALAAVADLCHDEGVDRFILGSGSNVIVADGGMRGVVIDNRARAEETDDGFTYRVESGASFAAFARRMCRAGRAGLTWAVGIPGTLGGAVVYNAGAYGGCLADVLTRVHLHEDGGESAWIDAESLGLVYRGSMFTRGQFAGKTVLGVDVRLVEGDPAELLAIAAAHDEKRLTAQPRGRNAGSMFKNPPEKPAWKLIDEVGMRGARQGDAGVSELHSNFFVNYGTARASDVASLVTEAERRVYEQFGIQLQREVAFVGAW